LKLKFAGLFSFVTCLLEASKLHFSIAIDRKAPSKSIEILSEGIEKMIAMLITLLLGLLFLEKANMSLIPSTNWTFDPRSNWLIDPGSIVGPRNEAVQPLTPLMSADLIESENDFHIHVDIPGVENLEITTEDNFLTITADRKIMREQESDVAHTVERSYGKVRRRLLIPANADADHSKAKFRDGVLTVTLPKKQAGSSSKKLTIE
jgi:HSP20 family protein